MELSFLGGATTVTGSQYLLDTGDARVLIDCGMFQGSPNETVRNRLPFEYDPREIDEPLYTEAETLAAIRHFKATPYDIEFEVAKGVTARFVDAVTSSARR